MVSPVPVTQELVEVFPVQTTDWEVAKTGPSNA